MVYDVKCFFEVFEVQLKSVLAAREQFVLVYEIISSFGKVLTDLAPVSLLLVDTIKA